MRWAASSDHETLVASVYRPAPEKPVKQRSSRAHMHTRRASRERSKRERSERWPSTGPDVDLNVDLVLTRYRCLDVLNTPCR